MFGLRGRAMASSLARQIDAPPIHLTVFYSRPADAEFIELGLASGPNPPSLSLVQVPRPGIMQRALLYSGAAVPWGASHVVYCDADLWYPPGFWRNYAQSLSLEKLGYWSCRIKAVSPVGTEEALGDWRTLTEERLAALAPRIRYGGFWGRVGAFQCVPAGFLRYPASRLRAVHRVDIEFSRAAVDLSVDGRKERRIGEMVAYHFDHPQCWWGSLMQL
jgi:hypothetical protein